MSTVLQYYGFPINYEKVVTPDRLLVGMECEIESVRDLIPGLSQEWGNTTDGSLRNNGIEFISRPNTTKDTVSLFKNLHAHLKFRTGTPPFSERTSIHVHANCANLTLEQTQNIIKMYALFEEYFFRMVSSDRRHNIHCVALTETYLPHYYNANLPSLVDRWHKYTALNIKPLKSQGTIEFRHMHGTDDAELVTEWLDIIDNLFELKDTEINKKTFNMGNIQKWFGQIFGTSRLRLEGSYIEHFCSNSILDIKGSML